MSLKNVLIIEDEPDLSAIIQNMVEVFGYQGQIAETADKAKKSIKGQIFDFFIIDLTLPDINGIQLYREIIKLMPEYRGKAIFTSGLSISEELRQIMDEDGTLFLAKPFTIEKFQDVLDKIKLD